MTRPDVKTKYLGDFLDWSLITLSQTDDKSITDTMVLDGVLQSLVNAHRNTPADSFVFTRICVCSCNLYMPKKLKAVRFRTGRQEMYLFYKQYLPNRSVCGARSFAHNLKLDSVSIIWIFPKCFMHKLVTPRNTSLIQKDLEK